jgi:hypothetical protein
LSSFCRYRFSVQSRNFVTYTHKHESFSVYNKTMYQCSLFKLTLYSFFISCFSIAFFALHLKHLTIVSLHSFLSVLTVRPLITPSNLLDRGSTSPTNHSFFFSLLRYTGCITPHFNTYLPFLSCLFTSFPLVSLLLALPRVLALSRSVSYS